MSRLIGNNFGPRGQSHTYKDDVPSSAAADDIIEIGATVLEEFRMKHSKQQQMLQLRPNNAIAGKTYNIGHNSVPGVTATGASICATATTASTSNVKQEFIIRDSKKKKRQSKFSMGGSETLEPDNKSIGAQISLKPAIPKPPI